MAIVWGEEYDLNYVYLDTVNREKNKFFLSFLFPLLALPRATIIDFIVDLGVGVRKQILSFLFLFLFFG